MTIIEIQTALREVVRSTAVAQFGVEPDSIAAETPPKTELGDLAFPVAFELAKKIKQATGEKKNPREIAETLGPILAARGLLLVGLDIIGDCITEINVTSPTCFQEITQQTGWDVAQRFIEALKQRLN